MKCHRCQEITSFIGETRFYVNYYDDENDKEVEVEEKVILFKYFVPSLHIIELKEEYPEEIRSVLKESFSLYFSSYSSCVNILRVLLEELCLLNDIDKYNEEGNFISLNSRIKKLKTKLNLNDDTKTLLFALKWIGNEGSHSLKNIKKDDIDNAYIFLKELLDKLYPKDFSEYMSRAKEIEKNKGLSKK